MISSTSGCVASSSCAYSSIPRRTAATSTENIFTELKNCLRVLDRRAGFPPRVVIHRRAALEPIRVTCGNIVFVELSGPIHQFRARARFVRQVLKQLYE